MNFDSLSDDISLQINSLNIVIPILMHFWACSPLKPLFRLKAERCKPIKATCHPTKCDVINNVKLFSYVIQSNVVLHHEVRKNHR